MRDPEFIARTADAAAVMGQAAHDYGPGSPEALGAAKALEDMHAADENDAQDR
ncbi:hypothetical protein [Streptomyces sp. NPDC057429]|uniref:hypothetical protein n=1 Tax=Streptomyces sp. NPDC057429 TaxID=3346130 RepID=UPI0036C9F040